MSDSSLSLTRRRLVAAAAFAWLPTPARPRPAPADALTPLLAGVYDGQVGGAPRFATYLRRHEPL